MKCPYCSKDIKDDAVFCGFCGKQIPHMPPEEASPDPPSDDIKGEGSKFSDDVCAEETENNKTEDNPKKKHSGLKVLLVFVLLAFISGSVLGFLTARGIVCLEGLIPNNNFKWTSFSEGQSEPAQTDDTEEEIESEKGESPERSSSVEGEAETSPLTEAAGSSSEHAPSEEIQQ